MTEIVGRRATDTERIDELQKEFIKCSSDMTLSVNGLTGEMRSLKNALEQISDEIKKYNDSGLPEIIKTYNEQKGFVATSEKYGKRIVWITAVGGAIATIIYFIKNGVWPSVN